MAAKAQQGKTFNVMVVGQNGRLQYEALLFAASLRRFTPDFRGRLFIAEPQPGTAWQKDPRIGNGDVLALLDELEVEILPFENNYFGESYPYGNKIEALAALPEGEPFVFFDTDTLITGDLMQVPFDFGRPTASLRREGTWPQIELYGPGYGRIWKSLYDKFGLDFESSLDLSQPDEYWRRYLYFNAGFFFYECPRIFGETFLSYALAIRDDPPPELIGQVMDPWLDQVALPLVIHGLGGGRDALPDGYLDGTVSCHYRLFPMLYAREADHVVAALEEVAAPNRIKKVLKQYDPIKRMVYQNRGQKARALFDQNDLPRREQAIRNRLRREGFWMR
ncbi:hypothetical protein FLO80_04290 [Aquicoccus porphyridii]|uniref:Uncharacterized protein n=1 Tax=Aquicoccus porphyridii TaxID=1852029 RepID=A0A5A9ZTW0_9RHOB|nr:hypothetical protein [Aquicoccus porphyridii]KAA0920336.1 hypothetical protein FLO80_04290 [Aquicoccus porphyridii]RAI54869.1 hypothetical protein DOO74_06490 [Rhodobacteraceae bacterium AsT-22]